MAYDEIRCEFACGERKMVLIPNQISFPPQGGDNDGLIIERLAEDMYHMPDAKLFTADII
jgi:hypothetical protein